MSDTQENTTQEQVQQESADLTINDLNSLKTIIDISSTRGAFKANELEAVGKVYNKLSTFLEQVAKQAEANAGAN